MKTNPQSLNGSMAEEHFLSAEQSVLQEIEQEGFSFQTSLAIRTCCGYVTATWTRTLLVAGVGAHVVIYIADKFTP